MTAMTSATELSGLIPVNKPTGMTSKDVSRVIVSRFGKLKIGHVGTLDPDADGVLPVLIGRATRLQDYLLNMPKAYSFEFKLGTATDSLDASGNKILELPWDHVTIDSIRKVASSFLGQISQTPPLFSAVKYKGKELYKYARSGKETSDIPVQDLARVVEIRTITLDSCELPFIRMSVQCSKGTYVRSLALDIAEALATTGHVTKLTRTESAGFSLAECISIEHIKGPESRLENLIVPFDRLAIGLPTWSPDDMLLLQRLVDGQTVLIAPSAWPNINQTLCPDALAKAPDGRSVGIVTANTVSDDQIKLHLKRGFQCHLI